MQVLCLFTCHNRKKQTINCIRSLQKNDVKISFLIVDDNSSDGTYEYLSKLNNVCVYRGTGSLFYSGGMRYAIEIAKKKDLTQVNYIMLINDDVDFYDNAIDKLISYIEDSDLVIGATNDDSNKLSYSGLVKKSRFKPEFNYVMSTEIERKYCDTFCANCVLMKKDSFINSPNIDKKFVHSMGDLDYGFTIHKKGYKIVSSNFFVGQCNDNRIQNTWRDSNLRRMERFKKKESPKGLPFKEYQYFLRKNYGLLSSVFYSFTPYIRILLGR